MRRKKKPPQAVPKKQEPVTPVEASAEGGEKAANRGLKTPTPDEWWQYDVFRKYRLDEHNLINCRLTWFLAIQGFLFAAYGFSIQKFTEVQGSLIGKNPVTIIIWPGVLPLINAVPGNAFFSEAQAQLRELITIIPYVGCGLSFFVFFGVLGAGMSLKALDKKWNAIDPKRSENDNCWLPNPAGGGDWRAALLGISISLAIPIVIGGAWGFILKHLYSTWVWTRFW